MDLPGSTGNFIGGLFDMLGWLLRFVQLMLVSKAVLAAKLLATQSQLAACVDAINRNKAPKPRFTLAFRPLWIPLSKWLPFLRNHLDVAWATDYYHIARPHQGLGGETPVPHEVPDISSPTRPVSTPVLGRLHHTYHRVAA